MAKVFSQEDGNLSTRSIITSRNKVYSDIDLTFEAKSTGDVYKKTDAAAVKQAIKNLLLTNYGEKPFRPYYGGDLNRFLFQNDAEFDEIEIQDRVANAIVSYEPRAILKQVIATIRPDQHSVDIEVKFQVVNTPEEVVLAVSLTRLR
jgi:phage baseplate assembly protein W